MTNPNRGGVYLNVSSYENPDLSDMSGNLTDVMDHIGFSEQHRENRVKVGVMHQMMYTIHMAILSCGHSACALRMGSSVEGTTADGMGSDQDILYFSNSVKAFCNKENTTQTLGVVFTRDNITPAGYTKLQPACKGCVINEASDINLKHVFVRRINFEADNKRRLMVAHFTNYSSPGIIASTSKHGPAETFNGIYFNLSDVDVVLSFLCNDITNELEEWYNRDRPHNWPSKDTRDLYKTLGCFVVPIGHPSSPEQHIEWRISFSLQERHLMWQLNPTQYHCFMLLKLIKLFLIKPRFGDVLTSYHCKTLLFYTIERHEQGIWIPENLILCLRMCLNLLHQWISNKYIPNYFIPNENMFVKMDAALKDNYDNLKICVAVMCENWVFLFHIAFNDFGKHFLAKLKFNGKQIHARITENTPIIPFYEIYGTSWFSSDCTVYMKGIQNTLNYLDIVDALLQSSRTCNRYITFDENVQDLYNQWFAEPTRTLHTPERAQLVESYRFPIEDSEIQPRLMAVMAFRSLFLIARGSVMAARYFQTGKKELSYLHESDTCLELGKSVNPMASMLVKATVLLKQSLFDSTNVALNEAESISEDTQFWCLCYGDPIECHEFDVRKQQHQRVEGTVFSNTDNTSSIIHQGCLYFSRNDYDILPVSLTFERSKSVKFGSTIAYIQILEQTNTCVGDDITIIVDPVMYLYYLQYLNNQQQNPGKAAVALQKMENELFARLGRTETPGHTGHIATWLNVLGDIYVKKGWRRLALRCFKYSHKLNPFNNAVRWHVMFLLFSPSDGAI